MLLEKDAHVSFANCGLPYYIGGEIEDRSDLLVTTPERLRRRFDIDVRTRHEARTIDRARKTLTVLDRETERTYEEPYDKLILATGADPIVPPIAGVDARNVYTLRNLEDTDRIHRAVAETPPRRAVVIGAGAGIGQAAAIGCADHGAWVACMDIDADAAAATLAKIEDRGGAGSADRVDIIDAAVVSRALGDVHGARGRLDVVVCTPGVNVRQPLLDYTDDDFDRVVGLNLKGNAHVLQSAGRIMSEQGSGSIVLFSSIRSLVVEPGQSMYAATKAGIVQLAGLAEGTYLLWPQVIGKAERIDHCGCSPTLYRRWSANRGGASMTWVKT